MYRGGSHWFFDAHPLKKLDDVVKTQPVNLVLSRGIYDVFVVLSYVAGKWEITEAVDECGFNMLDPANPLKLTPQEIRSLRIRAIAGEDDTPV
jgi:hypothetical protein